MTHLYQPSVCMRREGYSSRSVCLSVCLFLYDKLNYKTKLQATGWLISNINSFSAIRAKTLWGDLAETTAFERYGVKTSEKANMHNQH